MKKLSPKQYAELLIELTHDVKKSEVPARIEQFLKLIVRGRMLAQIPRIVLAFRRLTDEQAGIARMKVTSARKLSRAHHATLLKALGAKELAIEECEDAAVIGGIKVEIEDLIIDGTVQTQLTKLKQVLTQ